MKNNKGFTLVELLATISILAIISIIAIPSIINLTTKNEKSIYVQDAKRFISLVQYEVRNNKDIKKALSSSGVKLDDINHSDITTSPKNKTYSGTVTKGSDDYYVCLTDGEKSVSGSLEQLNSDEAINYVYDGKRC